MQKFKCLKEVGHLTKLVNEPQSTLVGHINLVLLKDLLINIQYFFRKELDYLI